MREIKFRAWDTDHLEMLLSETMDNMMKKNPIPFSHQKQSLHPLFINGLQNSCGKVL